MSNIKEENIFEKVKSVIVDYVKEKETDYAILLNGDWGCGKTYFVEKILNKELKKYKSVHISVAGIKDITEFINDIYLTKASKKINNKHTLGTMKAISKYSSYGVTAIDSIIKLPVTEIIKEIIKDVEKNKIDFSNTLIVIDDLERISETIKIEDFLYRIHDTFIHGNVKVLFVANESEINKNNNQSEYKKIKEKIIRHTISLHDVEEAGSEESNKPKSFESIFDSIAKNEKDIEKYFINNEFFKSHIEDIKYLFNEREHFNLRTFLTYLSLAKKILLIDDRLKKHEEILKAILNNLCFVLIELNKNNIDLLKEYSEKDKANNKILTSSEEDGIVKFQKYHNEIRKLTIDIGLGLDNFALISNNSVGIFIKYIETGYLNEKAIIREYQHIMMQDEEYKNAYGVFTLAIFNEEKDLKKAIKVVISKIKSNPDYFSLDDFINIYNGLEKFSYLVENIEETKDMIENNIRNQISKFDRKEIENYNDFQFRNLDESRELNSVINEGIDLVRNKMDDEFRENLLNTFNNSNDHLAIHNIDERYNKKITTTLETIFDTKFLEKINVRPFSINLLKQTVYHKILHMGDIHNFRNELMPSLKNLENYINGLDYNSYGIHLKKQIDALKEEIETAKERLIENK